MVQRDGRTLVTISLAARMDTMRRPEPFQVKSYNQLLRFPAGNGHSTDGMHSPVDAIIVPTIRPARQLHAAAELARQAQCQLISLHTDSFPDGLASVLARLAPGAATALALRSDARHDLLQLRANLPQSLIPPPALDISRKRNLGLLIGRACGWTRMLFLDDDVCSLDAEKLKKASALLPKYPVVGLQVKTYPDASVVGHARRKTGYRQEPFISGGALLVDPQRLDSFFPPVYHEDWLCVINHLRRGEVAIGGTVGQLSFQPFNKPERAALEEFGDILAAGLLWIIVNTRSGTRAGEYGPAPADRRYWREAIKPRFWEDVLKQRARLLDNLAMRLGAFRDPERPLESLKAARKRLEQLTPHEFVSFTEKWLGNLVRWRQQLADVPEAGTVAMAMAGLSLSGIVRTHPDDPRRQPPSESGP